MASTSLLLFLQVVAGGVVSYVLWALYASPLKHVPGPFLAKLTDLQRLLSVFGRQPEVAQRKLHDKYGPAVRLGPNMVSISDPAMIGEIYSRKQILIKGDFYKVQDLNVNGRRVPNVFTTRDEQMNTQILRPITKLFSMGQMLQYEPLVDNSISFLLECLTQRFALKGRKCDIHNWLHYCAWDVIGDITFSRRLGFMEEGRDVQDMMTINNAALDYVSVVAMMPWLDYLFERNPIKRIGPPSYLPTVNFIMERIAGRRSGNDGHDKSSTQDMLDGYLEASDKDVNDDVLLAYIFANVAAGSDTVAAELRSIIYHLCKNPATMQKLAKELDDANVTTPVSWAKTQELPYLCACVQEGFRVMPGASLPLERFVGPSGLVLPDGTFLPPGTTVGINAYVVNRDRGVYGEDAHVFRPERWLKSKDESESSFEERLSRMRATDLTFGSGKRSCIGRNLALLETHKIIASLVRTFDIKLVDPEREWKTHNAWLIRQSNMDVTLSRRS